MNDMKGCRRAASSISGPIYGAGLADGKEKRILPRILPRTPNYCQEYCQGPKNTAKNAAKNAAEDAPLSLLL